MNVGQGYGSYGPQQWQNGIQGVDAYTLQDNVTKIIGAHTLRAGLMWRRDHNWYDETWGRISGLEADSRPIRSQARAATRLPSSCWAPSTPEAVQANFISLTKATITGVSTSRMIIG